MGLAQGQGSEPKYSRALQRVQVCIAAKLTRYCPGFHPFSRYVSSDHEETYAVQQIGSATRSRRRRGMKDLAARPDAAVWRFLD
jgi:hypothetical protein